MLKCKNCNCIVSDDDKFCPQCGGSTFESVDSPVLPSETATVLPDSPDAASEISTESDGKPKKKVKPGIIIAVAAAVLCVAAAAIFLLVFNSPSRQFIKINEKIFAKAEPILNGSFIDSTYHSVDGSISLSCDNDILNKMLRSIELTFKMDEKRREHSVNEIGINYNSTELLSAILTAKNGQVGIYLPELADGYYLMDASRILELSNDNFTPEGELQHFTRTEDIEKAYKNICSRYNVILTSIVDKDSVAVEKVSSLSLDCLDAEAANARVYTFTPDAALVREAVKSFAEELRDDTELASYIVSLSTEPYFGWLFTNENSSALDAQYTQVLEAINELSDGLLENASTLSDEDCASINIQIALCGKELVMYRIEIGEFTVELNCTNGKESKIGCSFSHFSDVDSVYKAILTKYDDGKSGDLTFTYNDRNVFMLTARNIEVTNDVYCGNYELLVAEGIYDGSAADDMTSVISLDVAENEDNGFVFDLTVKFDGFGEYDIGMLGSIGEASLKIETTGKPSTAKIPEVSPTDVTEYSDDDLNDLFTSMEESFSDILSDVIMQLLGGLMG